MNPVLLDTHTLVWQLEDNPQLGRQAAEQAEAPAQNGAQLVSAMTFLEVAMLAQRRRLDLHQPVASWRQKVLDLGIVEVPLGIVEVSMSGDIGILAAQLDGFPADPADRIITATAMALGATLITADSNILEWTGPLSRQDARK